MSGFQRSQTYLSCCVVRSKQALINKSSTSPYRARITAPDFHRPGNDPHRFRGRLPALPRTLRKSPMGSHPYATSDTVLRIAVKLPYINPPGPGGDHPETPPLLSKEFNNSVRRKSPHQISFPQKTGFSRVMKVAGTSSPFPGQRPDFPQGDASCLKNGRTMRGGSQPPTTSRMYRVEI